MCKEPNLVNGCFFRMFLFLFFDNYYRLLYLSDLIWLVSYLGSLFNLRLSSIVGGILVGGIQFFFCIQVFILRSSLGLLCLGSLKGRSFLNFLQRKELCFSQPSFGVEDDLRGLSLQVQLGGLVYQFLALDKLDLRFGDSPFGGGLTKLRKISNYFRPFLQ